MRHLGAPARLPILLSGDCPRCFHLRRSHTLSGTVCLRYVNCDGRHCGVHYALLATAIRPDDGPRHRHCHACPCDRA